MASIAPDTLSAALEKKLRRELFLGLAGLVDFKILGVRVNGFLKYKKRFIPFPASGPFYSGINDLSTHYRLLTNTSAA